MKKLFISLCAMMAMCLAGFSVQAAVDAVYICGAINGQGWKPGPSAIKLSTIENGWFKLDVTSVGELKVSSTVGSTDNDWNGFNAGVYLYTLANEALNAEYATKGTNPNANSSIPAGTKVLYISCDMQKAAVSDGTWVPEAYSENGGGGDDPIPGGEYTVKVDVTIPGWTAVNCYYWGGSASAPEWPGDAMTHEGNNIWSITFSGKPENVIFNNGNGEQTIDLDFENNKTYVLRSKESVPGKGEQWTETPQGGGGDDPIPGGDYFVNVDVSIPGWTNVNCYYWGGATAQSWPGDAMTHKGNNIWTITFPSAPANVIFNNNAEQTVDLEFENGKTYVLRSKVPVPGKADQWTTEGNDPGPVTGLSNTLPVLYINIYQTNEDGTFKLDAAGNKIYDNYQLQVEEIDKNYRSGEYWLDMNGCTTIPGQNVGSKEEPLPLEMKGRGNWTRKGFAKKPFKLKLGKKQTLLGMGDKSKHWAILAHADDNFGYMRNFTGFNLGQRIGLPWTPSQQPVEVVINGNYRGLYFLTESIRVGDGRVPIAELNDNETQPELISGGYLVELDNYDETNQTQMAEKVCSSAHPPMVDVLRVTWDTPEEYSEIQQKFIREQFSAMNDLVGQADKSKGNDLWSYLDLDDAARYYIVMEICSHTEAYHGSTYLFRDRGADQKWHFSPLWDMGNAFNGPSNNYFYTAAPFGTTWLPSMLCNAKFMDKVKETWKWFMSQCYNGQPTSRSGETTSFFDDLDAYASAIAEAAKADRKRWAGQPTPANGQEVCDNSDINSRKAATKEKINSKINWLKQQWGDYSNGFFAEPERDTTPAAKLPEYVTGIGDILDIETESGAPVYYNLQGIRVAAPEAGNIYIELRGTTSRKVAF